VSVKPGKRATSVNRSFYVIVPTGGTGVPVQAPSIFVPGGCTVAIRAHNGQNTGNTNIMRVANQQEILAGSGGDPITPDTEISWPCDNTGQIWIAGTAADGVRISIQAGRLGQ
jgi:hypothetical protein